LRVREGKNVNEKILMQFEFEGHFFIGGEEVGREKTVGVETCVVEVDGGI
jgi:hypothetical protein